MRQKREQERGRRASGVERPGKMWREEREQKRCGGGKASGNRGNKQTTTASVVSVGFAVWDSHCATSASSSRLRFPGFPFAALY